MAIGKDQFRNAFPGFRIYVFGLDVTKFVLSVNVVYNDGRAPNLAEFQLENKFDKFVVTETDILAIYDDIDPEQIQFPDRKKIVNSVINAEAERGVVGDFDASQRVVAEQVNKDYSETIGKAQDHIITKIQNRIDKEIFPEDKAKVLKAKIAARNRITQPPVNDTGATTSTATLTGVLALGGDAARYPVQAGDSIFHSNDPVRIFFRDPFNPAVWFHMFAGFVTDTVDSVDVNNVRVATIRCEDPTRILRYARIATNPSIVDINALQQVEDVVLRSFFKDNFVDITLTELLYTFIFGDEVPGTTERFPFVRRSATGEQSSSSVHITGAGSFSFNKSATFLFGPEPGESQARNPKQISEKLSQKIINLDNLAEYQAFIDHQVKESDLDTMLIDDDDVIAENFGLVSPTTFLQNSRGEDGKIRTVDIINFIGTRPHLYPVDGGRLIILAPKTFGPNTNRDVMLRDIVGNISTRTSFKTRLQIIYDVAERLEFSFYASPKGDLIFEMPLYDFRPEDFGTVEVPTVELDFRKQRLVAEKGTLEFRGPFSSRFIIPRRDTISWSKTFTDEKVRTQMRSTKHIIQGYAEEGTTDEYTDPIVTTLKSLVPQFGVRMEQQEPRGFIRTQEGVAIYNQLALNQWNSDARSAQVEITPRLQMWLNRPIEFVERKYMATIRSISHNIVWNSDMISSVGVNYIRGWSGQTDPARTGSDGRDLLIYEPLGGFASRPLNYAIIFGLLQPKESTKSGPGEFEVAPENQ